MLKFPSLLAKLDSKQQALILGHAVPMPVVVKIRPYDEKFYAEIGDTAWDEMTDEEVFAAAEAAKADLGFWRVCIAWLSLKLRCYSEI